MRLARRIARLTSSTWVRLAAFGGLVLLAILSLTPADQALPRTRLPGPVEHFIAYVAVAAFAALAFYRLVRLWVLTATMIAYAAMLEYAQRWSPGRSESMVDFVASGVGVIVGVTMGALVLWILGLLAED